MNVIWDKHLNIFRTKRPKNVSLSALEGFTETVVKCINKNIIIPLFLTTNFLIQFQVSSKRIINKLYINKPPVAEPYVAKSYNQINQRNLTQTYS